MTKRQTPKPVNITFILQPTESQRVQLVNLFARHCEVVKWVLANYNGYGGSSKRDDLRQLMTDKLPHHLRMKSALLDGISRVCCHLLRGDMVECESYPILFGINAMGYKAGFVSLCLLDGRESFGVPAELGQVVERGRLLGGEVVTDGRLFRLTLRIAAPDFMRWIPSF